MPRGSINGNDCSLTTAGNHGMQMFFQASGNSAFELNVQRLIVSVYRGLMYRTPSFETNYSSHTLRKNDTIKQNLYQV